MLRYVNDQAKYIVSCNGRPPAAPRVTPRQRKGHGAMSIPISYATIEIAGHLETPLDAARLLAAMDKDIAPDDTPTTHFADIRIDPVESLEKALAGETPLKLESFDAIKGRFATVEKTCRELQLVYHRTTESAENVDSCFVFHHPDRGTFSFDTEVDNILSLLNNVDMILDETGNDRLADYARQIHWQSGQDLSMALTASPDTLRALENAVSARQFAASYLAMEAA